MFSGAAVGCRTLSKADNCNLSAGLAGWLHRYALMNGVTFNGVILIAYFNLSVLKLAANSLRSFFLLPELNLQEKAACRNKSTIKNAQLECYSTTYIYFYLVFLWIYSTFVLCLLHIKVHISLLLFLTNTNNFILKMSYER